MSEAYFLRMAYDLIDALKSAKSGASDAVIRNIVTGGITNGRDVLLDELHSLINSRTIYSPVTLHILELVAALDDYGRSSVCAHAAAIIRERAWDAQS